MNMTFRTSFLNVVRIWHIVKVLGLQSEILNFSCGVLPNDRGEYERSWAEIMSKYVCKNQCTHAMAYDYIHPVYDNSIFVMLSCSNKAFSYIAITGNILYGDFPINMAKVDDTYHESYFKEIDQQTCEISKLCLNKFDFAGRKDDHIVDITITLPAAFYLERFCNCRIVYLEPVNPAKYSTDLQYFIPPIVTDMDCVDAWLNENEDIATSSLTLASLYTACIYIPNKDELRKKLFGKKPYSYTYLSEELSQLALQIYSK